MSDDRFPTHDETMAFLACGRCHGPITKQEPRLLDGVTWTSWACENDGCEANEVACFADAGGLDLGITRDPEPDRRNDFHMFFEEWAGLQGFDVTIPDDTWGDIQIVPPF